MPDCQVDYEQVDIITGRWRVLFRENNLPCAVGPAVPRDPNRVSPAERIAGSDLTEASAIYITSTPNRAAGTVGGKTSMARPRVAAERIVFHGFREATVAEIDAEKSRQQALLDERIAAGRNISRKEDSKFGKLRD